MKTIAKIIGVLLLFLVVALGIGVFFLDSGIKKAVETLGPQYTFTEVSLGGARLSPWSGKGSLRNLVVGNPEGFQTANAFSLGEITIAIDTETLTSDPIVIETLRIIAPEITYEQGKSGTNLQRLLQNIEKSTGTGASSTAAGGTGASGDPEGESVKLIIKDLLLSGGKIYYSNPLLAGKTLDLPLPDIHLTGVGEKSDGATGAEVVKQLLKEINNAAVSVVGQSGALKEMGQQMEGRVKDEANKLKESLGGLKGLFDK